MPATGASSPMRQGVTDTRRSLRILADYPSEIAQVTGTERLTWPSAARWSRRLRFCQVPIGVLPADTIPAVPEGISPAIPAGQFHVLRGPSDHEGVAMPRTRVHNLNISLDGY